MTSTLRVVVSLAAVAVAWAASAAPAQAAPQPKRRCVIVVGKAGRAEMSPVLSKTCGRGRNTPAQTRAAAGRTLLMEWFEHAHNKPSSLTRVYGKAGPCDRDGYRLRAEGFWANRISGFNTWNSCNVATGYDLPNISGDRQTWSATWGISVPWVGNRMNDRIESFWIRRA